MSRKECALERAISSTLHKRQSIGALRQLSVNPPHAIDFSSNDFLSLATSDELRRNFLSELQHGESTLGSGGSRLLDGNSKAAENLEREIAAFHNAEAGLLCNSGFDANVSIFSTLPQPGDIVVYDQFIHASTHDGMKLSRAAACISFKHNNIAALELVLKTCRESSEVKEGKHNVFVAVEAVYSMDGDVAPLEEICCLVRELFPAGNCHLIVDEAHSTGVFGARGRGLVCQLELEDRFTIRLQTFGKAMACNGAIILCSPLIRQYLINYARPLIYTTFMSYPALAAIKASYGMLMHGKTEPLAAHLWMLVNALHQQLQLLRSQLEPFLAASPSLLRISSDLPQSPIFGILSSEPKALAVYCQRNGLVVRGIVPPTVPAGAERIRVCLHAGNQLTDLDKLVSCIREWVLQRLKDGGRASQSLPIARARL